MYYVTFTEYDYARNNYLGWCSVCSDWTREQTEPDAENYNCPVCGDDTVTGAEYALLADMFDVQD